MRLKLEAKEGVNHYNRRRCNEARDKEELMNFLFDDIVCSHMKV